MWVRVMFSTRLELGLNVFVTVTNRVKDRGNGCVYIASESTLRRGVILGSVEDKRTANFKVSEAFQLR